MAKTARTISQGNTSESFAQAAERLLERKRIGLESVIEALGTVGYAVERKEDGGGLQVAVYMVKKLTYTS